MTLTPTTSTPPTTVPRPLAPEDGYFGPGSVTWRVLADPAAGPGGLASLFLQALHPRALAGVDQHSGFRDDDEFWPRLARTAEYVMTVTYGPRDRVEDVTGRVRAAHEHVRGTDPVTGRPYAAGDPDLLRWVHVTEVAGFLEAVRRAGAPISDADADRFYAEQVTAAELLGATDVPASRAEVADFFADMRADLVSSPVSRAAVRRLLVPPMSWRTTLTTPARPAWTAIATLGFALQPRWARRLHGVPTTPATDLAATAALRALRGTVLALPERFHHGPMAREALARERQALGAG